LTKSGKFVEMILWKQIKTTGRAKDGILTVPVPVEFEGRELEVIILSAGDQATIDKVENEIARREKVNRLLSVIGTAKDFNKTFDKHELYDQ